jgi:hypothetical protein
MLFLRPLNRVVGSSVTRQIRMAPKALVVLASGAEEMETVAAVDVMRRGEVNFRLMLS